MKKNTSYGARRIDRRPGWVESEEGGWVPAVVAFAIGVFALILAIWGKG